VSARKGHLLARRTRTKRPTDILANNAAIDLIADGGITA